MMRFLPKTSTLLRPASLALLGLAATLGLHVAFGYDHVAVLLVPLIFAAWLFGISLELLVSSTLAIVIELVLIQPGKGIWGMQSAMDLATLLLALGILALLSRQSKTALEEASALNKTLSSELETRTGFWSGAAHDLKHPLAVINLRADILQRRLSRAVNREEILNGIAEIRDTAHEMKELIDEMQDAAKLDDGLTVDLAPENTELVELTTDYTSKVCSRTGRAIRIEACSREIWGQWDRARIGRVLANLLSNALKYSGSETEVKVTVGEEDGWAVVRVSDAGVGIPESESDRVFDRFYRGANVRRKVYGTGLGLSGSLTIVEEHGGSIEVQSRESVGSVFTVRLPMLPGKPTDTPGADVVLEELLAALSGAGPSEPLAAQR
jgi:signal transduction histidine kinase